MDHLGDPHRVEDGEILHYFADFTGTTNVPLAPSRVSVRNARSQSDALALDRQGDHPDRRGTDADAIAGRYLEECEALIRRATGGARTWSQGPRCRFDGVADPKGRYDNRPARRRRSTSPSGSRDAIYNLHVVTPPPRSMPLALCDAPADELEGTVKLFAGTDAPVSIEAGLLGVFPPNGGGTATKAAHDPHPSDGSGRT
jgi:hypothetical protein